MNYIQSAKSLLDSKLNTDKALTTSESNSKDCSFTTHEKDHPREHNEEYVYKIESRICPCQQICVPDLFGSRKL